MCARTRYIDSICGFSVGIHRKLDRHRRARGSRSGTVPTPECSFFEAQQVCFRPKQLRFLLFSAQFLPDLMAARTEFDDVLTLILSFVDGFDESHTRLFRLRFIYY